LGSGIDFVAVYSHLQEEKPADVDAVAALDAWHEKKDS
jgi:hypothetical protein